MCRFVAQTQNKGSCISSRCWKNVVHFLLSSLCKINKTVINKRNQNCHLRPFIDSHEIANLITWLTSVLATFVFDALFWARCAMAFKIISTILLGYVDSADTTSGQFTANIQLCILPTQIFPNGTDIIWLYVAEGRWFFRLFAVTTGWAIQCASHQVVIFWKTMTIWTLRRFRPCTRKVCSLNTPQEAHHSQPNGYFTRQCSTSWKGSIPLARHLPRHLKYILYIAFNNCILRMYLPK